MVGYLKNDRQSNEASLKYLLFGTVATGSMLYGITILYGLTGTTKIAVIRDILASEFRGGAKHCYAAGRHGFDSGRIRV